MGIRRPIIYLIAASLLAGPVLAHTFDLTKLPLGDGKTTTTTTQKNYVYVCTAPTGQGGGASTNGPWIGTTTWDLTSKVSVEGSVSWSSVFSQSQTATNLILTGNGLPSTATGIFPIGSGTTAYQYDRNPNKISAQTINLSLPLNPVQAAMPSCLSGGAIGMFLNGSPFFDALDAPGRDAPAHEVQDKCGGHPEVTGAYHFHMMTSCMDLGSASGSSPQLGVALDGFPIYGPYENGQYLSNDDLDMCHGRLSPISYNGKTVTLYHYVANYEYPYTLGCYRGTPSGVSARASATQVVIPDTGWWYSESEAGRGYAIEVLNGKLLMSVSAYRDDGTPVWYVGEGAVNGNSYTLSLAETTGAETLDVGPPANAKTLSATANVTLTFSGPAAGTVVWSGAVNKTSNIKRFPLDGANILAPASTAGPQTGWWWSSGDPGTGYFIEQQGTQVFFTTAIYGSDGRNRWYYALGSTIANPAGIRMSASLMEVTGGQTLTSDARTAAAQSKGTITLNCVGNFNCGLTFPNGRSLALTRFTAF